MLVPMLAPILASWLGLVPFHVAGATASAPCTCPTARQTDGWCEPHGVGYVASVRIASRLVYDALDAHGHTLDLSTFKCEICRKAIETDGFCEKDRIGFLHKQAYLSRLTYELARGTRSDPAGISCPVCRKNAETYGWCDSCRTGMVGNVAMKDRAGYLEAAGAVQILRAASETIARCEFCALAMVTDTRCHRCRIRYKDGSPVPPDAP